MSAINNSNNPILKKLNSLRDLPDEVIAESFKVVEKFLMSSMSEPIELFLKKSLDKTYSFQDKFPKVTLIDDTTFESLTGYRYSSGVVALFKKPQFINVDQIQAPFVVLNGIAKAENVGAIVRTMSAFNFKTLIIDAKSCSPYLRRAIRVSMGNISLIKVHRCQNLLEFVKSYEQPIYSTANESDSIDINEWNPNFKSGFIIGSEGHGIDKDILQATQTIRIPINNDVAHLNAAASAAIFCSRFIQ